MLLSIHIRKNDRQTSNIVRTLVGNKIVDNSGHSNCIFILEVLMDFAKTTARRERNI